METVTVPKKKIVKLEQENKLLKRENDTLRNTRLYQRLAECLTNLQKKEYTRKDLGI